MSSNITSSSSKSVETAPLAKASERRPVEAKQAPPVEAAPAVVPAEPVEVASETFKSQETIKTQEISRSLETSKSQEKTSAKSEEVDQAMREKVKEAVENVRDFIKKNQRSLDFEMAEESNRVIITVIDRETNKVIRQIPPEDVMNISDQISNGELPSPDGMLFKVKA